MKTAHLALTTLCLMIQGFAPLASALPEARLNSRSGDAIPKMILETGGNLGAVKAKFSVTQVPELDRLWDSRQDVVQGSCTSPRNDCRVLSVFRGQNSDHPIVLLPGFTGYRKMSIEQIYDLLQQGYGPVYISDFAGTGDSYKPELKSGASEPTTAERLRENKDGVSRYNAEIFKIAGTSGARPIAQVINQIPLGIGFIPDFEDYQKDVAFIMAQAVHDNPTRKIVVSSVSMSGLVLMMALADQGIYPTWVSHVDRIILESPMIRILSSNLMGTGLGSGPEILSGFLDIFASQKLLTVSKAFPEFVDKALGRYNPANGISHSANRLSLSDSLRVWNGHETLGASIGWGYQTLHYQYSVGPLDTGLFSDRSLNDRIEDIARALRRHQIPLTVVGSWTDPLVDTRATQMFLGDLAAAGTTDIHLCTFQTSRHVIDQESEYYREPFMALLADQKVPLLKSVYGVTPRNELLHCQSITTAQ